MVKQLLHYYKLVHPNVYNKNNHVLCNKNIHLNKYNCTNIIDDVNCPNCLLIMINSDYNEWDNEI